MQTLAAIDLPLLLATYHAQHPGIELAVREEPSDTLAAMLRADAVDLAILSVTDRIERRGLQLERARQRGARRGRSPRGHPLAGRRRLRFAELAGEEFIGFREGWALRHILEQAAAEAGFTPQIAFESNEVTRIRALVARGLGVAVLPRSGVEGARTWPRSQLTDPRPTRDVTLAWRADRRHAPAADAFIALAREVLRLRQGPGPFPTLATSSASRSGWSIITNVRLFSMSSRRASGTSAAKRRACSGGKSLSSVPHASRIGLSKSFSRSAASIVCAGSIATVNRRDLVEDPVVRRAPA